MKKKIFTLLTLLLTVCSGAWADDDPTLTVNFIRSGSDGNDVSYGKLIKNYSTEGITLKCYGGTAGTEATTFNGTGTISSTTYHYYQLGGVANALHRYSILVTSSNKITKISYLICSNNSSAADVQPVLTGWEGSVSTTVDYYALSTSQSINNSPDNAKWFTFDLSGTGKSLKTVELYRNINANVFTYNETALTAQGGSTSIRIWAVKVWTEASAPIINTQPSSATYIKDASVTLSVVATPSTGSCNYQWYSTDATKSSSTELVGETGATLSVSTATAGNFYYYCTVGDGGANTTDTEVACVRVSPNATLSTWDFASITADDVKYNTEFWAEGSANRRYDHSLASSTDTKLEDNFENDLLNGVRVRRQGTTGTVNLYIGDGLFVAGNTDRPGKFIVPVTESCFYKVTYSCSYNGEKETGFGISGATLYSGELTHTFTSRWSEHATFVVKATSTSLTLTNEGYTALRKIEEVEPDPAVTSVTPNGGAVNGGTSVTIVCDGTSHYLWSESSSATIGVGDWTTGTSVTVPNVAGTRYLHVYASNSTENSAITTKEFTITKQASAVIKQWDFTQEMSATDIANLKADGTNWTWTEASDRYANKTSISAGETIQANSQTLEKLDGLTFCDFGSADRLRINNGDYLQMNGSNFFFTIPSLQKDDVVSITYLSSSNSDENRSWTTPSNASRTSADGTQTINGSTESTPKTVVYTVSTAGNTQFKQSKGLNIKRITVSRSVPVETVTKRSDRTYGTYVTTNQLDFTNVSGMEAYIATSINGGKTAVTLQKVTKVPAGTPIIVKTAEQTTASMDVPVTTTATAADVEGNLFVEGDGTTAWNGTSGYIYYYLASDLFHYANAGTLQKGKAYLKVEGTAAARSLSIVFSDESETTGISRIENSERIDNSVYNLRGQRVAQPTKGLYIVNGKKVMFK